MSRTEKILRKWNEAGQPKLVWDSHDKGTYDIGNNKRKRQKKESLC